MIARLNTMEIVIYIVNRASTTETSNSEALSGIQTDPTLELKKLCSISYQDSLSEIGVSSDGN